jgi:hypothetical protein
MMKFLFIFCALVTTSLCYAQGGIGSSGGGDIVMNRQGQAFLVDLLDSSFSDHEFLLEQDAKIILYGDSLESKLILKSMPEAADVAVRHLEQYAEKFPIFRFIIEKSIHSLSVARTDAYFSQNQSLSFEKISDTFSSRVRKEYQVLAAVFEFNVVLMNDRILSRMSPRDQEALFVHEVIRNLNYFLGSSDRLTTDEIEKTVRVLFLNESHPALELKLSGLKYDPPSLGDIDPVGKVGQTNQGTRWADASMTQEFQKLSPERKLALTANSILQLKSRFSKIIASPVWRDSRVIIEGKFNVFTHELDCTNQTYSGSEVISLKKNRRYTLNGCQVSTGYSRPVGF